MRQRERLEKSLKKSGIWPFLTIGSEIPCTMKRRYGFSAYEICGEQVRQGADPSW